MAKTAAHHYEVRWRVKDTLAWSNPQKVSPVSEVVVEGLQRGSNYEFEVRAVSACGAASIWVPSDYQIATAPPPAGLPNQPTGEGKNDGIWIDWGDGTGVRADTQYEIQRAPAIGLYETDPPGPNDPVWVRVAIVSGTTWLDAVTDTYEYWYRIRAVNYQGTPGPWAMIDRSIPAKWISSDGIPTKVQLQFNDFTDALNTTNQNVADLQGQIDGEVAGTIQDLLKAVFPPMAGDQTSYAGSQEVYVGQWSEKTARQTQDEVFAQTISLIGAMTADKKAFILDGDTIKINDSLTLAQRLSQIDAVNDQTSALITEEQQARISGDNALSQQIQSLQAQIGTDIGARIDQESQARVDGDNALADQITSLQATVNDNSSSITTESTARANGDSALSQQITNVSSTVNGHTTSITQLTQTTNGILGKWGIAINSQGRISGIQLNSGGSVSAFDVSADSFSVTPPGGGARMQWSGGNIRVYDASNVLRVRMGVW